MTKLLTFILGSLLSLTAFTQQKITITGLVKDEKNKPLAYADILITTADENEHILDFSVTDSKGKFSLEYTPQVKKMKVEINFMGFKKKTQVLDVDPEKQIYYFTFVLDEKTEALKEVEVKAKPRVRIVKDTTKFNLQNIVNGSERNVEEVMNKLPGMELQGDGKFKFKGKKVTNVLLDDTNLFNGAYTIGTKNIKAEDIVGIEAVENYTANPLLQGVKISDDVAVILRFRPGLSLANNMELGYGHKDRYYGNHTGIAITKKIKAFSLFNYNNLGKNVGINKFNPIGYLMGLGSGNSKEAKTNTFLESSSVSALAKAQQSNRNNAMFGSLNIAPSLSKKTPIRINLNYMSDKSLQEQSYKTIITTDPDNPIVFEQSDKKKYKPRYFNADINLQRFWGKNSVENVTQFTRLRNTNDQMGISNGEAQELKFYSKEFYLYNSTKLLRRFNDSNVLSLRGTLAFNETPERMYVMPGINFDSKQQDKNSNNFQDITSKKESANLKGYFYHKINNNSKINLDFGVNYSKNSLSTELTENDEPVKYSNNVDYKLLIPHLNVSYRLNYKGLEVSPRLGLKLYDYKYIDKGKNQEEDKSKWLMNASLSLRYKINRYHTLNTSVSKTQQEADDKNLFTDFVMTSNRSMTSNELNFDPINSQAFSFSYSYSDMLNDFSAGLSFSYNDTDKKMQSALDITQDLSQTIYFLSDRGSKNYSYNGNLRKFVSVLNSSIRWNSSYNTSEYYNLVNSTDLRKNESKFWNHSFSIETNFIGPFIFSERIAYSKRTFSSVNNPTNSNEAIRNDFSIIFKPNNRFIARADYNYNIPTLSDRGNYNQRLDASLQLYNKKKSINYKLQGCNLLDQKSQSSIMNSDYAQTVTNNTLQQRYFLFSVGFRF